MKLKLQLLLFAFPLLLVGCFGSSPFNKTVEFDGLEYQFYSSIPMAFGTDTIYSELWYKSVNVENDFLRIIRYYTPTDTTTFNLPKANQNHTISAWYSLLIDDKRYLWYEDNFGTTVFDIDSKETKTVILPEKELKILLPNGAPVGEYKDVTRNEMKKQLGLNEATELTILDSLKFVM